MNVKEMEIGMNVLDLRAVTCNVESYTQSFILWIVKVSFLKSDFVVQRKLVAVHYWYDFLRKLKTCFGCICSLCNRPNHNTTVYSSGSNSNTYSELYVCSSIIQHLHDTCNTSISGAENNSFGSLTANSSSTQQRSKNVGTRHQAEIKRILENWQLAFKVLKIKAHNVLNYKTQLTQTSSWNVKSTSIQQFIPRNCFREIMKFIKWQKHRYLRRRTQTN